MSQTEIRFLLFFLIVFGVIALGYAYVGWRLISPSGLGKGWKLVAWAGILAMFLLPVTSVFLDRSGYVEISSRLAWITYVSMGFFSFLFTFILLRDAGLSVAWLVQKAYSLFTSSDIPVDSGTPPDPGRRRMMIQAMNLGIIGVAAGLTAYGVYEARRRPAIKEIDVPVRGLPPSLDGFRIVQITDIHAGLTVRKNFVELIVEMTNSLNPDLIAFTGDMVDGSVDSLKNDVSPLAGLRAKHGVYFVTGNHEYYSGAREWVEEARRLGMNVLLNSHAVVNESGGKLLIAGVTDHSGGEFFEDHISDPALAVSGAPACDARILLAHQPRSLYKAMPLGFDLLLTGHTHGGQFFPWNFAATAGQPYLHGLHDHEGTWIYVSRGTGYWGPPVRLGSRSEITVVKLKREERLA